MTTTPLTDTELDALLAGIAAQPLRPWLLTQDEDDDPPHLPKGIALNEETRNSLLALIAQLRSQRDEAWNEIATGFDAIFPYVMEANDAEGNPLSLPNKIDLLVSERNAFHIQSVALRTRLQQVEESARSLNAQVLHKQGLLSESHEALMTTQRQLQQVEGERDEWLQWADRLTGNKHYLSSKMRREIKQKMESK